MKIGDRDKYISKTMEELLRHIGRERIIGADELFEKVFEMPCKDKINDTRPLRRIIEDLRWRGLRIGSDEDSQGGGYFMASSMSELKDFLRKKKRKALRELAMVAKMEGISVPELLGQMRLNIEGGKDATV